MTYTENEIKEALDLAQHQAPMLNWKTIRTAVVSALRQVSKQDNSEQLFRPFVSKYPSKEIKVVFHQLRRRTPV